MTEAPAAHFAARFPYLGELATMADAVLAVPVAEMTDDAFGKLVDFAELGPRRDRYDVATLEPAVECVECGHAIDPLEVLARLELDGDVTSPLCRECF